MGGLILNQSAPDDIHHAFGVLKNFIVPESDDPESLAFKPARPDLILSHFHRVLPAVHFDDETAFQTQ